ncbi:MAG: hypothetical protein WBA15_06880 [Mesorhizobium sp.]
MAADIDPGHLVADFLKGSSAGISRRERHGPFGRKTTHEDGNVLVFHLPSSPLAAGHRSISEK